MPKQRTIRVSKKILANCGSGTTTEKVEPRVSPTDISLSHRPVRCGRCFSPREEPCDHRRPCQMCGSYMTTRYEEREMKNIFVEDYDA